MTTLALNTPHPAENVAAQLARGVRREPWTRRRRLALMRGESAVFVLGPREEPTRCVLLGERKDISIGKSGNGQGACFGTTAKLVLVMVPGYEWPTWVCSSRRVA